MEKKAVFCFLLFCLVVTSDGSLDDITDLKTKQFGKEFPRHGLFLLYWFANNINIDQNDVIRANFDPTRGDFGFHRYRNYISEDGTTPFPVISSNTDMAYYALGNINDVRSQFPPYVTENFRRSSRNSHNNLDRIVIRTQRNNPAVVEEVYITQHYERRNRGSSYDPENTFQISTRLLRQIQSLNSNRDYENDSNLMRDSRSFDFQMTLQDLENLYPDHPGLYRLLAHTEYNSRQSALLLSQTYSCSFGGTHRRLPRSTDVMPSCRKYSKIKLEVKTTKLGYAKIVWSGLPQEFVKTHLRVGLENSESFTVYDPSYPLNGRTHGSIDTNVPLNSGLRIRLFQTEPSPPYITLKDYGYGPEFDDANRVLPTKIPGYEASLQLFVKDRYAGARLYIKKSFTNWKTSFYFSRVAFYQSSLDDEGQIISWCTQFEKRPNQDDSEDYDIYEDISDLPIYPGLQLRFIHIVYDKARTEPWEGVINPRSHIHDELR